MKHMTLAKTLGAGAACALALTGLNAQTSTTTTVGTGGVSTSVSTTTSAGSFVNVAPSGDYFTFSATAGAEPNRYYYSKETTVVDPSGRTVAWNEIRPEMPAKVYYVQEGDRMIVRKVVLERPVTVEKTTTTTTEAAPVVPVVEEKKTTTTTTVTKP